MADELALRVGGLEAVVEQIAATQARQQELMERVVRLEERQGNHASTLARLENEVRDATKGVSVASPWLSVLQTTGKAFLGAIGTAIAAYVAVRFGLPKG